MNRTNEPTVAAALCPTGPAGGEFAVSDFGTVLSRTGGSRELMQGLIASVGTDTVNMAVGNPSVVAEVSAFWRDRFQSYWGSAVASSLSHSYSGSSGVSALKRAMVRLFRASYGWPIDESNVLVTCGAQIFSFFALNAFGGAHPDGQRALFLPQSPEYPGAWDVLATQLPITGLNWQPQISGAHEFFYRTDWIGLEQRVRSARVVWLSRPCNPTGSVLAVDAMDRLLALCGAVHVPIIIDCAYALPVPGLQFVGDVPPWSPSATYVFSLSKAGLPGERIGVAVGNSQVIRLVDALQSNVNIHAPVAASAVIALALEDGSLVQLCRDVLVRHYAERHSLVRDVLSVELGDVEWYLHRQEGGIFAWLWLPESPLGCREMARELLARGVGVAPGASFFHEPTADTRCLRLSLTPERERLIAGLRTLCSWIRTLPSR